VARYLTRPPRRRVPPFQVPGPSEGLLLELLGSGESLDEQGDRLNALLLLCPSTHSGTIAALL